jgi:hypothetical protein
MTTPTLVDPGCLIEEQLDPHLFTGPAHKVLRYPGPTFSPRSRGAACLEGWRGSPGDRGRMPVYRAGHVGRLRFHVDGELWRPPAREGPWCLQPGDVVLNKMPPLRAAWAAVPLPAHPVDAGCLLVRGLGATDACWLAVCLNQPGHAGWLQRRSGVALLPRVRLSVIRDLPLAFPPRLTESLAERLRGWQAEARALDEVMVALQAEADRAVEAHAARPECRATPGVWWRLVPEREIGDALVPDGAALTPLRRGLRRCGWLALAELLDPEPADRRRQSVIDPAGRYLRLGDVGEDLSLRLGDCGKVPPNPGQAYAAPLGAGEVLLSMLVSSPRVGFVAAPPPRLYADAHWRRLRFRETPAAWALVLRSPLVREQLRHSAAGNTRQFAHFGDVEHLALPPLPLEPRRAWDEALRQGHRRRAELEARWLRLEADARRLYDEVYGPTPAYPFSPLGGDEGQRQALPH